jgi:hypothetical protein
MVPKEKNLKMGNWEKHLGITVKRFKIEDILFLR